MKRSSSIVVFCLLLTIVTSSAWAQFCPQCGTSPCRLVAKQKGIIPVEPPSPHLSLAETAETATIAARLLQSIEAGLDSLQTKALILKLHYKPVELFNTIDLLSQNHQDLKNPTTPEAWGRATIVDSMFSAVRSVYTGTLGTVPSLGAKIISHGDSLVTTVQGGPPNRSRVDQIFGILDTMVGEATGKPAPTKPPLCAPFDSEPQFQMPLACTHPFDFLSSTEAMQVDAETRAVREKLLYAVIAGYNEAGLYYQSIEFKKLADRRWGAVLDPQLLAKTDAEYLRANGFISTPIKETRGGDPSERYQTMFSLDAGKTGVVNYMVVPSAGKYTPTLRITCEPADENAASRNKLYLVLYGLGTDKIKISINSLDISLDIKNNRDSFNAVKVRFESASELLKRGRAGLGGTLAISINGQEVASMDIPLPNMSVIRGANGKPLNSPEAATTRYKIMTSVGGDAGAAPVKVQYSDR